MDRQSEYGIDLELENGYVPISEVKSAKKTTAYILAVQHRWYLMRWMLGAGLLFAIVALIIPPQYESVARLMPPDNTESLMLAALTGKAGEGLGLAASGLLGMRSSGALFVGILSSNAVEDRIVDKFGLQQVYRQKFRDRTRKALEKHTDISEDRKNGIISLKCDDTSPQRAQQICAAYISDLNDLMVKVSTGSARREREFLEQRLKAVKLDLDQASVDFSQFASKNTAIDLPQQGKAMVESAAIVQGQLIAAQAELRGLRQVYGPQHSRVRAVEARIDELKDQLQKLGGTDAQLKADDGSMYPPIRKLPLLAVTYTDLYRRAKIQEAVYEALTKQYEMAKVQEAKETPTVRVLDSPTLPEQNRVLPGPSS